MKTQARDIVRGLWDDVFLTERWKQFHSTSHSKCQHIFYETVIWQEEMGVRANEALAARFLEPETGKRPCQPRYSAASYRRNQADDVGFLLGARHYKLNRKQHRRAYQLHRLRRQRDLLKSVIESAKLGYTRSLIGHFSELRRFQIPRSADGQIQALRHLLDHLGSIEGVSVLELWLERILDGRIALPKGIFPDSPALALIARMLDIDFERGFAFVRRLIRPNRAQAFRQGYFQLSLMGALLVRCDNRAFASQINAWAKEELSDLQKSEDIFGSLKFALVAGLLALAFITEKNTPEGARTFEALLIQCMAGIDEREERRFFLQFLLDNLGQQITEGNFVDHLIKFIAVCKYIAHDDSVIWPRSGLLPLLRDSFPVEQLIRS